MQVDEITFEKLTLQESNPDIYQAILDEFGIDWSQVEYRDLWKPLYCGLAARLWIDIQVSTGHFR